ncbi:hypothetical protein J3R82DRAFT_7331 [Butyriboletus roseoflavus]|nr:hypothetical protein J3R82DRAFT_7331 [Butyriboletus roseoflavus]
MSPEQPSTDEPFSLNKDVAGSVASSETAVQERGKKTMANQTAIRLRSLASRHVLVKDTAFQTWYTLLNYLYTDKFNFLPLGSATPGGQLHESSTSSLDESKCSAKSMYRLACKVGLDHLRDEAFSYIRSNLTEHNILKELSCSLVSKHPQLLEMELDVLYSHIASTPVVVNFPAFAKRIANNELPHGADIILGIHTRLLKEPHPLPFKSATPGPSSILWSPGLVNLDARIVVSAEIPADETGPPHEDEESPRSRSPSPPRSSVPIPRVSAFGGSTTLSGLPKTTGKAVPQAASFGDVPTFSFSQANPKGPPKASSRGKK